MNFIYGLIVGAGVVWFVYHFNFQPALRAERDALKQKLDDYFNGKGKPKP